MTPQLFAARTAGVDVERSSTLDRDGGRRSSGFSLAMIVRTVQLMANRFGFTQTRRGRLIPVMA
jgi:hypothetical protein